MSGRGPPPPFVVKLGGSLAESDQLPLWLDLLGRHAGRVVLVPGGGPFADQVRATQARWDFDDSTAHHLALLAMEQYGRMLAGLIPALIPCDSATVIADALNQGRIPVWMPAQMCLGRPEIPESWAVTSDSLALWLADQIAARHVVLIKSKRPPQGAVRSAALAESGLVDSAFGLFLSRSPVDASCLGPGQQEALADLLAGRPVKICEIMKDGKR